MLKFSIVAVALLSVSLPASAVMYQPVNSLFISAGALKVPSLRDVVEDRSGELQSTDADEPIDFNADVTRKIDRSMMRVSNG
jgi:hypothetical protein